MSDAGVNLSAEQMDEPIAPEENEIHRPAARSAGAMLAIARQQKNFSVQQIAEQLKLSSRQILALEADQFDALPKMVIVRGFIRSYAKLLKVEAEPILAMLPKDVDAMIALPHLRPALTTPFLESRMPLMGRQDSNNGKYIWGAVILAVLALVFFLLQKYEHLNYFQNLISTKSLSSERAIPASDPVVDTLAVSASNNATVSQIKVEEQTDTTAVSDIASSKAAELSPSRATGITLPPVVSSVPVTNTVSTTPVLSDGLEPATARSSGIDGNLIKFKFRQDSWIQLKRDNGTILTSHLAKAGTEETFDVKEPLQIKIGNAAGVDGTLRGVSLNIAPTKDSNVFNLNVK